MATFENVWETREFAHEIKFLLDEAKASRIREWARLRLQADPNSDVELGDGYRVTSLYFDTARFDVFHRRGSYARGKYRVRRYGTASRVFLERKLKTRSLVTKRRSLVGLDEIDLNNPPADWQGVWFQKRLRLRGLRPICQISYLRTARMEMTDLGPVRLTIDQDLRAASIDRHEFCGARGEPVLPGHAILELKFRRAMPPVFKELMETFALTPAPLSKYRAAAQALEFAR
ncbi:MAG: polyphosphate polymerase domain-containing protein [Acidobacteria bacterium]|nr:polyphosphate polymerase domain-containing protein [Acidobacteriota bacterium]